MLRYQHDFNAIFSLATNRLNYKIKSFFSIHFKWSKITILFFDLEFLKEASSQCPFFYFLKIPYVLSDVYAKFYSWQSIYVAATNFFVTQGDNYEMLNSHFSHLKIFLRKKSYIFWHCFWCSCLVSHRQVVGASWCSCDCRSDRMSEYGIISMDK